MLLGFPGDSMVKNPPANAGDAGLIPGSRRSPGEGNGNWLQYSCLGNLKDRGARQATVHGVTRVRHDLAIKIAPKDVFETSLGSISLTANGHRGKWASRTFFFWLKKDVLRSVIRFDKSFWLCFYKITGKSLIETLSWVSAHLITDLVGSSPVLWSETLLWKVSNAEK